MLELSKWQEGQLPDASAMLAAILTVPRHLREQLTLVVLMPAVVYEACLRIHPHQWSSLPKQARARSKSLPDGWVARWLELEGLLVRGHWPTTTMSISEVPTDESQGPTEV